MARPRIFPRSSKPPLLCVRVSPSLYDRVYEAARAAGHDEISPFVRDLLARVLSYKTQPPRILPPQ